jgi:SHS2 domain-containing protein
MSVSRNKVNDFLMSAKIMIENALSDNDVKTALAGYGYDEAMLQAGKTLYDEAFELDLAQKKETGEKVAATTEFNNLWAEVDQQYMKTLKVARIVLKNLYKADQSAMLYGVRKQSFNGWQEQAVSFYANILNDPELMEAMAKFGYPEEKLKEEYEMVKEVIQKQLWQKKEKGESEQATRFRDQKMDELADFVSDLRGIAKVALADTPDYLEKLGILARSAGFSPSKKQTAAAIE